MFSRLKIRHQIVAIIITLISVSDAADIESIGPARNLTVSAFQDQNYDDEGSLKLNISWLPPDGGRTPISYSVIVTTVLNESIADPTSCGDEESLLYMTKNASQFGVALPEDIDIISGFPELTIIPGCTYRVEVFANPRKNRNTNHPYVDYKVPDCVGAKCSCSDTDESLPKPVVEVEILEGDKVLIRWEPAPDNHSVESYAISFGVPTLVSRAGLPVYEAVEIARVSSANNSYVWSNGTGENLDGIIYVAAEDARGCSGPQGSFLVRPIESSRYSGAMVKQTLQSAHARVVYDPPSTHAQFETVFIGSAIFSVFILTVLTSLWSWDRKNYTAVDSKSDNIE